MERIRFVFLVIAFSSCQLSAAYSYPVQVTSRDFKPSIVNEMNETCINSYLAIENSLLSKSENLVNLRQAFFPTNQQASISINVIYHIKNSSEKTVTYRWLQSSVLMFISSGLLRYLSLLMYNVKTRHTDIFLDPICGFSDKNSTIQQPWVFDAGPESYCKPNNSSGHHLLNNLTANLLSYAIHRNSVIDNGIDLQDESGYSVYVFGSKNPSDYCIFDEVPKFFRMKLLFLVGFGILEITSVVSIPLLLASVYEKFQRKMSKGNIRYFVWASLTLIIPFIALFLYCNINTIVTVLRTPGTHFHDAYKASIAMSVALGVFLFADMYTATFVMWRLKVIAKSVKEINCFGWYRNLCSEYKKIDNTDDTEKLWCTNLKWFTHYIVIVAVTYFTQLLMFNCVFVLIGTVAAPVETGSLLLLYITSLFSLISFFAVILKVFHNIVMKKKEQLDLDQENDPEPEIATINKPAYRGFFVVLVTLVCTLAAGIGVTVSFIYIYTVLNQEYRNNRGIITFLGALLPSILASTSGFFWTRVLPCIGKKHKKKKKKNNCGQNEGDPHRVNNQDLHLEEDSGTSDDSDTADNSDSADDSDTADNSDSADDSDTADNSDSADDSDTAESDDADI